MKITILGSGTCVPSLKRSSCSILAHLGQALLLFDCGAGTIRRLLEAHTTIDAVSFIFFSHLHPDHTGEFVSFLFATKYPENRRQDKPLVIVAAKGFEGFYGNLRAAYGHSIELDPDLMQVMELDNTGPDHLDFPEFEVDSLPMNHTEESLAYRITAPDGTSFAYSGDTDMCENLIALARDTDLLICESALPDDRKVSGHLTPSQAGQIATAANVKKLVLTHFYPECDTVDMAAQCRKTFRGPLILAEDLQELWVGRR
jgi:ribonuclease BN (tRNA processing enzyme)